MRLVVGHTAEGALTAEALGRYFSGTVGASSHVGIDHDSTEDYVPYELAAWTLRSGNLVSDNAELCGFAEMARAQWLSSEDVTFYSNAVKRRVTVPNPRAMLEQFAVWIA
ncbi:MAG: hypothetical protein M3443_11385, partial [Actinomycetota bacterium]|nr:hypothetical protein [Actinomycetota bacterium]